MAWYNAHRIQKCTFSERIHFNALLAVSPILISMPRMNTKDAAQKGLHLIVMIPAFNEEQTLAQVIESIPKKIEGISKTTILVINDGSTDLTATIARKAGAVVVSNPVNRGLAFTFRRGLDTALEMGADIIVNTDADNQYDQAEIPALVQPVVENRADIVLGSRFSGHIESMPLKKRWGNQLATWVVREVSGLPITDGQTGFRAFSRDAAMKLNLFSNFTYTQESILEAADKKLRVVEIPATFRKRADKNRLFSGVWNYASRAASTLLVGYVNYRPLRAFGIVGGIIFVAGMAGGAAVLVHYSRTGLVTPHLPLAVLSVALLIIGTQIAALGLVGEAIKHQRRIQEKMLYEQRKARLDA
jgi:glycosyltransferase involved in cell wall biosynthesis